MKWPTALTLLFSAVLVVACSELFGDTPTETAAEGSTRSSADRAGLAPVSNCIRFTGQHSAPIETGSIATDALHLSGEVFLCSNDVVVVDPGDLNEVAAASQLAAALYGPLLFPNPRVAAEIGRLDAERVHIVGTADLNVPSSAETIRHDVVSAVDLARETLGVDEQVSLPATPDASTVVDTVLAIDGRDRVVVPQTTTSGETAPTEAHIVQSDVVSGLAVPSDSSSVWMVDAAQPETILLAAAVGRSLDVSVVAFLGSDVLANASVGSALAGRSNDDIRLIGDAPDASQWKLTVLAKDVQLPGGGFYVLPEQRPRRYVAFYGHPGTPGLGVLGEQGPAETLARMQTYVDQYGADGAQVIPTFEMMASVAAGSPTDDNDYSNEWPVDSFTSWIDFAEKNDMYVVLDLQSGRDDFLTQAKMYEDLLELPYVGLALDPEWRLRADQFHLQQIGSVDAQEVNGVIDWLAALVRDNGLPQKMMIVHQFQESMIQNRETLQPRPQIQLIIQMDGEGGAGGEAIKDRTYDLLTQGTENSPWRWGWKNFFDEDEPGPPPPENVLRKDPVPVYVSYQ